MLSTTPRVMLKARFQPTSTDEDVNDGEDEGECDAETLECDEGGKEGISTLGKASTRGQNEEDEEVVRGRKLRG